MSQKNKLIFLTGFMGAGKSTVGRILAEKLQCEFIDLDSVIEKQEQTSIADIFAGKGEKFFRDCESDTLNSLHFDRSVVIATGGGLVVRKANRERMKALGKIVYLKTSWNELKGRLESSTARPLVAQKRDWVYVEKLWTERQGYYEDCDYIVDTDGRQPTEIAQNIMNQLAG